MCKRNANKFRVCIGSVHDPCSRPCLNWPKSKDNSNKVIAQLCVDGCALPVWRCVWLSCWYRVWDSLWIVNANIRSCHWHDMTPYSRRHRATHSNLLHGNFLCRSRHPAHFYFFAFVDFSFVSFVHNHFGSSELSSLLGCFRVSFHSFSLSLIHWQLVLIFIVNFLSFVHFFRLVFFCSVFHFAFSFYLNYRRQFLRFELLQWGNEQQ